MRIRWHHLAIGLMGLIVGGALFAWSGLFNVAASSGHWRITELVLHGVMQSSIRTYSLLSPEVPGDLDSQANIRRGAGHYETSCRFCHGTVSGTQQPILAGHMTPQPPSLAHTAEEFSPAELFRIVKHGIIYTGMPAWIAQSRDDEVWSMVAFLRAVPKMDSATYDDLAFGSEKPQPSSDRALSNCARCHDRDGLGNSDAFPILAGQSEAYLLESLRAFAAGTRHSGTMQFAVNGLDDTELQRLAAYYAARPKPHAGPMEVSARGREIATIGLPETGVPACNSCHGPEAGAKNPAYPRLAGQNAAYLAGQLRLFQQGARGGTGYAHIMARVADRLPQDEIEAVAAYHAATGSRD